MLVFLVLCLFVQHVYALRHTWSTDSAELYSHVVSKAFGMATGGVVYVDYNIDITGVNTSSYFVLVLVNEGQRIGWYSDAGTISGENLCGLPSSQRATLVGSGSISWDIFTVDLYSVIALQCRPSTGVVNVDITVDMKNLESDGNSYAFLPIETLNLIRVYQGEILFYFLLLAGLIGQYLFRRQWVKDIHKFFGATLICAIVNAGGNLLVYNHANREGYFKDSLVMLSNLLEHFFLFAALMSLLLLSMGWSTLRMFITPKERSFVQASLIAYFIVGFANAFCIVKSTACSAVSLTEYVLRCVLYLGIIIALNFSVTQLRIMLLHSPWVSTLSVQYARSKQFQMFRTMFVLYLLLPTFFILVESTLLSWKEYWLVIALGDLLDMFLIFHVGATFSPMNEIAVTRAFGTFNGGPPQQAVGNA